MENFEEFSHLLFSSCSSGTSQWSSYAILEKQIQKQPAERVHSEKEHMMSNSVKSVWKLGSERSILSREGRRTRRWFRKHTRCLQPFKYQMNVLQSIRTQNNLKFTCQELLYCPDDFVI